MVLINRSLTTEYECLASFRPLAGIMVLINSSRVMTFSPWLNVFPSPCGDYGSYQLHESASIARRKRRFPSPCGDYGSYRNVSIASSDPTSYGFRPLAGIMVLIYKDVDKLAIYNADAFPSPCGDYGSYRYWQKSIKRNSLWVSVPLRGLWFLSAPFINAFMKPSKWHFAGRIIYFHHFSSFARKWFSKKLLRTEF